MAIVHPVLKSVTLSRNLEDDKRGVPNQALLFYKADSLLPSSIVCLSSRKTIVFLSTGFIGIQHRRKFEAKMGEKLLRTQYQSQLTSLPRKNHKSGACEQQVGVETVCNYFKKFAVYAHFPCVPIFLSIKVLLIMDFFMHGPGNP